MSNTSSKGKTEPEVADLPKFRINEIVRYKGYKADVVNCFWDGQGTWRYEVEVRRGKMRGLWTISEDSIKLDDM